MSTLKRECLPVLQVVVVLKVPFAFVLTISVAVEVVSNNIILQFPTSVEMD